MSRLFATIAAAVGAIFLSSAFAQPSLNPLAPATTSAVNALPEATPEGGAHELTAADVNAWLDGFMPYAMAKSDIPGAVVSVVKDGQVLTARGYGEANIKKGTPVDPSLTLFRPGSISKLFIWTSVMQLVEQGKLDLNADVNKYLDFKIPERDGNPITLTNIMTHTAGFEESAKDIITTDPKAVLGYDVLLKRHVPARVYAAGSTPAYSNYATSLAGYIVQRVSGMPLEQYIERNIFQPLGMNHSTFRQPLPANLKPLMAEGYRAGNDKPFGYEFIGPWPAGSLASTGEDMAKFMIAHLQDGGKILRPETAKLMHANLNSPIPGLNSMAHGFYESSRNGHRVISHGGDTVAFHSDLNLFIDDGVGIFMSINSGGKEGASLPFRVGLLNQFADRYFPDQRPEPKLLDAKAARANAEKLAGIYSTSRRAHSSFLDISDLLGQEKVTVDADGNPVVPFATHVGAGRPRWQAIGPMLWKDKYSDEMLGAVVKDGKATRFSIDTVAPIIVWDRTPTYRSSAWILPLLYLSLAVLFITALFWPVRAVVRRRYDSKLALEKRDLQSYRLSRGAALAILLVLVGWIAAVSIMSSDVANLSSSFDPILYILQALSFLVFVGGFAAMLWYAYIAWKRGFRWTAKAWSLLLVIASGMVLYVAVVFHLIGWTVNY